MQKGDNKKNCTLQLEFLARARLVHHGLCRRGPLHGCLHLDIPNQWASCLDIHRCLACRVVPVVVLPVRSYPRATRPAALQPQPDVLHNVVGHEMVTKGALGHYLWGEIVTKGVDALGPYLRQEMVTKGVNAFEALPVTGDGN